MESESTVVGDGDADLAVTTSSGLLVVVVVMVVVTAVEVDGGRTEELDGKVLPGRSHCSCVDGLVFVVVELAVVESDDVVGFAVVESDDVGLDVGKPDDEDVNVVTGPHSQR